MHLLKFYREHPDRWLQLSPPVSEGKDFPENEAYPAITRYELLLALQYDWLPSDHALIRHLFEQEIIAEESDGDQPGIFESFELAAYLLARYKAPGDIALFYRAKHVSFDKACGFDQEFMFWALGQGTMAYVRDHSPSVHADMEERYDESPPKEDLDQWWSHLVARYPDSEDKEQPMTLFWRSICFGRQEEAQHRLEAWRDNEPASDNKVRTLIAAYNALKDYKNVIALVESQPQKKTEYWDQACRLRDLVDLHRQAGTLPQALDYLEHLDQVFARFDNWKNAGLGHMAISSAFKLSLAFDDISLARHVFCMAEQWHQQRADIPFTALETARQAAIKCMLPVKAKMYGLLADAERARIDAEMAAIHARSK